MDKLSDLDICKRIAEIEGFKVELKRKNGYGFVLEYEGNHFRKYNPLRDDGICFKLMVKYGVTVNFNETEAYIDMDYATKSICFDKDKTPNKAILLAIIAHKESNNE